MFADLGMRCEGSFSKHLTRHVGSYMAFVAIGLRSAERYPHSRHQRQREHQRLYLFDTLPVFAVQRKPTTPQNTREFKSTPEDWSLHISTSPLRPRAHSDQQRRHLRIPLYRVLFPNMGHSHLCRCHSRIPCLHRESSRLDLTCPPNVFPLPHSHGIPHIHA